MGVVPVVDFRLFDILLFFFKKTTTVSKGTLHAYSFRAF